MNKNCVIEFYEEWHYNNNKLSYRDIIRRNKIIDKLDCLFVSINYKNEIEVING